MLLQELGPGTDRNEDMAPRNPHAGHLDLNNAAWRLGQGRRIGHQHQAQSETLDTLMGQHGSAVPQLLPIRMPATSTRAPPSMTFATAESGGVSMYLHWIQAIVSSSSTTTTPATMVAVQKSWIK